MESVRKVGAERIEVCTGDIPIVFDKVFVQNASMAITHSCKNAVIEQVVICSILNILLFLPRRARRHCLSLIVDDIKLVALFLIFIETSFVKTISLYIHF